MQNTAANATWTGRAGSRTPGKAESVSNEIQPIIPDVSTKVPSRRISSLRSVAMPINVKLANNSAHHQFPTLANPKKVRLANDK
jgi:hypothetical protein